ncbi:MAG: hypothetical protein ABII18_06510 [bacterium]|nr:hypothetical protein [bacterium]MBU1917340.1 hypothetical protein [bacterium]
MMPTHTPFVQQALMAKVWSVLFPAPDAGLIRTFAEQTTGPHLALGVAAGREIEDTLAMGRKVIGVDANPDMLGVTRERFRHEFDRGQLRLVEDYFSEVDFPKDTGFITMMGNTLPMVLERSKRQLILQKAYDCLMINGKMLVVLHQNYPEGNSSREQVLDSEFGQITFKVRWEDNAEKTYRTYFAEILLGDQRESVEAPIALMSMDEFLEDATKAGFEREALFGDHDMSDYSTKSQFGIHVLVKK